MYSTTLLQLMVRVRQMTSMKSIRLDFLSATRAIRFFKLDLETIRQS